jgi:pimeloyl-ACP methyl ester carboxylesterase
MRRTGHPNTHAALHKRDHAHGRSEDYSIERMARDTAEIASAFTHARLHVAGMSLGGVAAAEFALTWRERVKTLTMVDVGPGSVLEASSKMRGFINDMITAPSVEGVIDAAMQASPKSDKERVSYRMRALLRERDDGTWEWKRDPTRITYLTHILERIEGLRGRVGTFDAPFMIVRGSRSKTLPSEAAAAFAASFSDGRCVEVANAGHNVPEDNPAALIRVLRTFWTSASQRPRSG